MLNGISTAPQQIPQLQQSQQQQPNRQPQELREHDRDKDDAVVARARTEAVNKSNPSNNTQREERRQVAVNDQPTRAAGKEAAQRRGSLLDITA